MSLNILALVLVALFLWGSIWLYTRFANKRRQKNHLLDGEFEVDWESPIDQPNCPECDGSGAKTKLGAIHACNACEGTGVASSASLDS